MRKVFVSYAWRKGDQFGFGNMDWEGPIFGREDVSRVRDLVKEELGFDDVIVLSWQPYG